MQHYINHTLLQKITLSLSATPYKTSHPLKREETLKTRSEMCKKVKAA